MKVFVIDSEEKPCLPTTPRRARQLLDQAKATVRQVVPFTIKLNKIIDSPVGEFEVGIDDGAKHVGIAIKNKKTNEIVFHAQMDHRLDVSLKVEQRRNYRHNRRRRLRCRKARFSNRIKSKISPSIRQRKEAIVRVIKDFNKRLKLVGVIVEEVFFNHAKYTYGKYFSLTEIGKTYLKNEIGNNNLYYVVTYGYVTKQNRISLGLTKKHSYDACAILNSNNITGREFFIKPRRTRLWENNPNRKCTEKQGFKHFDLIKSRHNTKGIVIGSIRGLNQRFISVRTKFDDNFHVSYLKSKLLQRFTGLIYFW